MSLSVLVCVLREENRCCRTLAGVGTKSCEVKEREEVEETSSWFKYWAVEPKVLAPARDDGKEGMTNLLIHL